MKVLLLADPSNPHTIRWANSLNAKGIEIFIVGLSKYIKSDFNTSIKTESLKTPNIIKSKLSGNWFKGIYFFMIPRLKGLIKEFKPDIMHAHYAGSYGLIGALSNFHPSILSVWGVDINIYPKVSFIHKSLIKYALSKADIILATSNFLKNETMNYVNKDIKVTPFGIDLNVFKPQKVKSIFSENDIVIGTVKRLEEKYGIDFLIRAFAKIKHRYPDLPLKLLLVGDGSIKNKLVKLVQELGIETVTVFAGNVPHNKVVEYHNMIDIAVFFSKTESFGVSVLEAAACEKPVIVRDVGGLPEVAEHGVTGYIIKPNELETDISALERLVLNPELRRRMGKAGREKVISEYDWNENVNQMINIYENILKPNENT